VAQILSWADAHKARTGEWPHARSGHVHDDPNEEWLNVNQALRLGLRGLPGGDSLARVLERDRGVRNMQDLPPLTARLIVRWAREHRRLTGAWPTAESGAVAGAPGEVWANVNQALREGGRGLPGGDSLAWLLARRLGVRNQARVPPLSVRQVLAWADAYHGRHGRWPTVHAGGVAGAPGESWCALDDALRRGHRGLPGGHPLARLLRRHRAGETGPLVPWRPRGFRAEYLQGLVDLSGSRCRATPRRQRQMPAAFPLERSRCPNG
jgi:hypothetical protein